MKKVHIPVIFILAIFMLLSACGSVTNGDTTTESPANSLADIKERTPSQVMGTLTQDDKELVFDAAVVLPDTEALYLVTLARDEGSAERMANDLVLSKYENASKQSSWDWDAPSVSFSLEEDSWLTGYTDFTNDLDGSYYNEDKLFEYGYITDVVPSQMELTAEEAGDTVCAYFEDYTDLTFQPYRILAADSATDSSRPGYYTVWVQAIYDNVPLCLKADTDNLPIRAEAYISNAGIFGFQGLFLLKQSTQESISEIVPLDSVMSQFEGSFATLSVGDQLTISRISLEYFAKVQSGGTYTLRPVWSFYGASTRMDDTAGTEISTSQTFIYFADDGSLCGVYY